MCRDAEINGGPFPAFLRHIANVRNMVVCWARVAHFSGANDSGCPRARRSVGCRWNRPLSRIVSRMGVRAVRMYGVGGGFFCFRPIFGDKSC